MPREPHDRPTDGVLIRSYEEGDYLAVTRMHARDPIAGGIEHHEPDLGFGAVEEIYFSRPQDHIWFAETAEAPIGMIGVVGMNDATAQIRWLHVDAAWEDTDLPCRLLHVAIEHCRQHDYLKIVIMSAVRKGRALPLVECLGFQYSRAVNVDGQEMLEFYLDLYAESDRGDCLPGDVARDEHSSGVA